MTALTDALRNPLNRNVGGGERQEDQRDVVASRTPLLDRTREVPAGERCLEGEAFTSGDVLRDSRRRSWPMSQLAWVS
jgi:hypothetical protein